MIIVQHLKNLLAASATAAMEVESGSSELEEEDSFFCRKKASVSEEETLMQYVQTRSDDMTIIAGSPVLKKLFIQLNTPLPASAAAERLFSYAGLTMSSRRTRMSNELFENLVMLKVNKDLSLVKL